MEIKIQIPILLLVLWAGIASLLEQNKKEKIEAQREGCHVGKLLDKRPHGITNDWSVYSSCHALFIGS